MRFFFPFHFLMSRYAFHVQTTSVLRPLLSSLSTVRACVRQPQGDGADHLHTCHYLSLSRNEKRMEKKRFVTVPAQPCSAVARKPTDRHSHTLLVTSLPNSTGPASRGVAPGRESTNAGEIILSFTDEASCNAIPISENDYGR